MYFVLGTYGNDQASSYGQPPRSAYGSAAVDGTAVGSTGQPHQTSAGCFLIQPQTQTGKHFTNFVQEWPSSCI